MTENIGGRSYLEGRGKEEGKKEVGLGHVVFEVPSRCSEKLLAAGNTG